MTNPASSYWNKMTPAERSAEMKRRRKVGLKKNGKNKMFQCKQCNKIFKSATSLASHVRYEHPKKATTNGATQSTEAQVAYAFGHCEAWLANFSERVGLSRQDVTRRVGQLLQR